VSSDFPLLERREVAELRRRSLESDSVKTPPWIAGAAGEGRDEIGRVSASAEGMARFGRGTGGLDGR